MNFKEIVNEIRNAVDTMEKARNEEQLEKAKKNKKGKLGDLSTKNFQFKLDKNINAYIDDNSKLKVTLWDKTIDNIFVHNDTQCSDIKVVKFNKEWYNGNTGVNKINIWRFNDIKDYVKTPNFLANEISIKDNALHTNLKWYNRNEIVSQFVYVIMTFNNTSNNYEYELQEYYAQWIVDNRNN